MALHLSEMSFDFYFFLKQYLHNGSIGIQMIVMYLYCPVKNPVTLVIVKDFLLR